MSGTTPSDESRQTIHRLRTLREAALLLSSSLDWQVTLANTVSACLPALGDFGFFDVALDGAVHRVARAFDDPDTERLLQGTQWVKQDHARLNLCALSTNEAALHVDIDDAWYREIAASEAHLALMRRLGFTSMLTTPMRYGDELIGALTLFMGRSGRRHTLEDREFAGELAALAAPVIVNVRFLEKQRRAESALRASEERLRLAVQAGGIGIWDWNVAEDQVIWSPEVYALHGLPTGAFGGRAADFTALVHPDDRQAVQEKIQEAIAAGDTYACEFRALLPDGSCRWLSTSARIHRDAQGMASRMIGATRDITPQRRTQEQLEALNAALERELVSSTSERDRIWRMSQDILAVVAPDGTFASVNPALRNVLGWTVQEVLAHPFDELVHGDHQQEAQSRIRGLLAGKNTERFELPCLHRTGGQRWISWIFVAEHGSLYGVGRDVTERRKQREQLLLASEERLQFALEVGGMGAWQWNMRTGESTWWPGMDVLHGLRPGQLATSTQDYLSLVHPDDREMVERSIQSAVEGKSEHRIEYRVVWPDGSTHWLEGRGRIRSDETGEPQQMAGICTDITARKRTEQGLRFLAAASAELAVIVDPGDTLDKVAKLAVPGFADWCAVDLVQDENELSRLAVAHVDPDKAALGHELFKRYPPDPQTNAGVWQVIRSGCSSLVPEITEAMLAESVKDQEYLDILTRLGLHSYIGVPLTVRGKTIGAMTFVSAESRRVYGWEEVALAEDIARRAAVAIENARIYRALQDADRRKDEFLAMLAHELRNPLAPIRAASDLIKMPLGEAGLKRTSEVIARQVDHMTRLVDDLLDVSRVTRGRIELECVPVDAARVVAEAVEQVQTLIDKRRHRLEWKAPDQTLFIRGDPKRLVQIVANLLANAAKFTPDGGRIAVAALERDGKIRIIVRDNGIGMASDLVARAFDLFTQAERTPDRSQGGLGLGLALVKRLVELHGGSVWVSSKGPGRGSEFTVELPRLDAEMSPSVMPGGTAVEEAAADALRVLIVDDNRDAAAMLKMVLETAGHRVASVHEPEAAIERAGQEMFDVFLLDIGLPGMDGNALAGCLKQSCAGQEPAFVAITGYGQEQDRSRSLSAGFDHYLVKPAKADELLALLKDIAGKRPKPQP